MSRLSISDEPKADKHDQLIGERLIDLENRAAVRDRKLKWLLNHQQRMITVVRTREVRLVLQRRYEPHGGMVPDDDAGRDDLEVLLSYVAEINRMTDPIGRATREAMDWAPWMSKEEATQMAEHALRNPIRLSADDLAERLGVTYAMRSDLKLTTIGSTDVSKAERAELRRQRNTERMQASRRKAGVKPRDEYLAEALSTTKPWEAEGVCRRTWERRRAQQRALVENLASPNVVLLAPHLSQRREAKRAPASRAA